MEGAGCGVSSLEVERPAPGSASAPPAKTRLRLAFIYDLFMVYWGFISGVLRFDKGWLGVQGVWLECRVKGAGCRVSGAGCRAQGAGCRV